MPYGIYDNIECEYGDHPPFTPQEHQQQVLEYFISKSNYKGLCLFHRLGSGKSCSSIITSDAILNLKENKMKSKGSEELPHGLLSLRDVEKIYILTPGSLRQNFIEEYCNRCGYSPRLLKEKYIFMTINYSIKKELNFDNSLVIIDEIHNLINGVKNMTPTASKYYRALMNSKCRIIGLTGTPIFNYIWEWPLLGNLLKPNTFPNIIKNRKLNPGGFLDKFKINENGDVKPKRPLVFKNQMSGIISYFPGKEGSYYPQVVYENPVKVPLSVSHSKELVIQLERENKSRANPPKESLRLKDPAKFYELQLLYIMAQKWIISRSLSNFQYPQAYKNSNSPLTQDLITEKRKLIEYSFKKYPKGFLKEKKSKMGEEKEEEEDNKSSTRPELFYSKKEIYDFIYKNTLEQNSSSRVFSTSQEYKIFIDRIKNESRKIMKDLVKQKQIKTEVGWINQKTFGNRQLTTYSRKFLAIVINILTNWKGKHVVFSFFKTKAGVNMLSSLFKMCGVNTAIYSGDVGDKVRQKILNEFNSESNRYGEKIKVLLITEAGAEGINILEARHMHIVESSPREMKIQQVIGRVVRYRSHMVEGRKPMPRDEQKVQIWRYWSVLSEQSFEIETGKGKKKNKITITKDYMCPDEYLYLKGLQARKRMKSFLNLLKKNSVTPFKENKKNKNQDMKKYNYPVNKKILQACKIYELNHSRKNL